MPNPGGTNSGGGRPPKSAALAIAEALPAMTVLYAVQSLPLRLGRAMATGLGLAAWALVGNYRRVAMVNLDIAFRGSLARQQCRALARASFVNFARTLHEVLHASGRRPEGLLARTRCADEARFIASLTAGRGVIVCSAHLSNWYWPALYAGARGARINVVARPLDNRILDRNWSRQLARWNLAVIPRARAVEDGIAALQRGEVLALMVDQNVAFNGTFAPFFGTPASTSRGVHVLHQATRCPVLMVQHRRRGVAHEIEVSDPLDMPDDEAGALTLVNRQVEQAVRADPGAYFWLHPRWKKRPPGVPSLYQGLRV